jgi:hypothetical protein
MKEANPLPESLAIGRRMELFTLPADEISLVLSNEALARGGDDSA